MNGRASPYDTLGLPPGADQDAVDRAYRQLIKRYHPDRADGDAARAAEITQAYRELRRPVEQEVDRSEPVFDLAEALYAQRAARRRQVIKPRRRLRPWPLMIILLFCAALVNREKVEQLADEGVAKITRLADRPARYEGPGSELSELPSLDQPLNQKDIADAVARASELIRSDDPHALVEASRDCHRSFRDSPSVGLLDSCSAFDDAVIEMENRESVRDGGAFGPSAVTARQIAAARVLSSDFDAIEERLDRIRSRVQNLLAPPDPPVPPEPPLSSGLSEPAAGPSGSLPPLVGSADGAAAH